MEHRIFSDNLNIDNTIITPDLVRGLSLGKLTETYGTIGLYTHLVDALDRYGFGDNELVQTSLQLGLTLHANDERTSGHYTDHLMRVTLHMLENFNIENPNIIAAGPLHDIFEDHPRDLVLSLTGEKPTDKHDAMKLGRKALAILTNEEVVEIVESVTNPDVQPNQDKQEVYSNHIKQLVLEKPLGRVVKLADFIENACGNHATIGDKQRKLDDKYIDQYRVHMMGLFMPDSIITGKERQKALHMLSLGHARALGRIAMRHQGNGG